MSSERLRHILFRGVDSLDHISGALRDNVYTEGNQSGFNIQTIGEGFVASQYVEKVKSTIEVLHPNGNKEYLDIHNYLYVEFSVRPIDSDCYLMKVVNPPVSLRSFISSFRTMLLGMTVEKYVFDVSEFYRSLIDIYGVGSAKAVSLKASSVPMGKGAFAKIEMSSHGDSYERMIEIYGADNFLLKRLEVELLGASGRSKVQVSDSGLMVISGKVESSRLDEAFLKSVSY